MKKVNPREKHHRAERDKRRHTHKMRNVNREIVDDLCRYLHGKGIKLHVNASATSNTYYIKLDYGALFSIRVSNHMASDRKHNHRFNIVTESIFLPPRDRGMASSDGSAPTYYYLGTEVAELKRAIMDQLHAFLVKDGYYEIRVAEAKARFEYQRENKTNAFAARATEYDPRHPGQRYLTTLKEKF